ncbi:hypothetical protein [Psychrobacter sp. ANT_WB68]|uniref:hypothetical protein n=1 Tax=Psychrobacter sp. ANT_WB68 TaxID=2597355 RepID=UPI0011F38F75|nr:hypothetical protein [Psychrobacter sp. ANT_WB68]KAA0915904.1 hypothetical protein FQ084_05055 [Psychrobacter sp. ANT_WB68]
MQKTMFSIMMLLIGFPAMSATANLTEALQTAFAMKVTTIANMYQQDVNNQGQDYPVVLQQYGSQELQAAMQLEQDYFDRKQASCHIGYDVLWSSQDPDYGQDKEFSVTTRGLVQVSLAQGNNVYYELSCDDSACKVVDVILDEDGTSLREHLLKHCR